MSRWRPEQSMFRRADSRLGLFLGDFCVLGGVRAAGAQNPAQEPAAPQTVSADQLKAAIDKLGNLDFDVRTGAARTVRRTVATQAVPALLQTVAEHADGYVRYRALVILTGFNDPRTQDAMRESRTSPNDRLRTVAYSFFEHHPDRAMIPDLLLALDQEQGEFVRPALVRALAAQGDDPRVRQALLRDVVRGEDFFRSAVIEALGDYKAVYAYDALVAVAKLDGPLQDGAAAGLGALAVAGGHDEAAEALFDIGIPSHDPTRAPVSLALATIALRNTPLMLSVLGKRAQRERVDPAVDLVGEGFDSLEEDLDKET